MPPSPPKRRRLLWLLAGGVAVLGVLAAVAAVIVLTDKPGNVSHPNVEFNPSEPAVTVPGSTGATGKGAFDWPVYGYSKARTRYLPLATPLRPPFAERWKISGSVLLEFPPAMGKRSLYLLKNNGALYGITRQTGKVRWKTKVGYLAASSPAYAHNTVYAVLLERGKGIHKGKVVAVNAKNGAVRWARNLPSRSESSPLIDRGHLYFGSENGTVYALNAGNGSVLWTAKAKGAVKGGLALDNGRLFVGDYGGKFQAFRARDGHVLWRTGGVSRALGLSTGQFYATPAAAYGRVFVGNTDGFVYSFAQSSGKLAWRTGTGNYVYGSPAVAPGPGGRPTVFVGSYDGHFYALDAQSGRVQWVRHAEGKISGGAVVLGDLVFYSTLNRHTTALGVATGKPVWTTHRGAFNPVVSNGRGLFLVGYTNLFGLDGRPPNAAKLRAAARHKRFVGRRAARRQHALNHRVSARRRAVRQRNALRRSGAVFCYRSHGRQVCRTPKPLVCFKVQQSRRTVCRPRVDGDRRR